MKRKLTMTSKFTARGGAQSHYHACFDRLLDPDQALELAIKFIINYGLRKTE